ncbi:Rpn family recombination-promoting nuclease/putative transposase [Methylomusa anaerophila]|uniref:PD-(D/E)XK nuclease family transposase n=1 Tax=Methylomusa anaerophila TaxID=1930071 RepID=A0A348AGM9_9FIRM|nr:Rpn family recombination-promoting nuclease/putative transposase [Methylomusa anaerophila]BBB90227.1 PD-(D/E)XK nuclease family transposase [Methylomusa anaerophila]
MEWDLNRLNDYLFKWVFGREEHKDILLNFLNSVLSVNGSEELTDITLAERELDPAHLQDKLSRLDILGKASDGSFVNIEVQIVNERDIDKRTLYYWAKLYQSQLQSGQTYKELCRTVTINVLGFSFLPETQPHHSVFSLYDIATGYRLNRDMEVHFLELPKWKTLRTKPRTRLEKWLTYLGNYANPQEMEEIVMSEPAIQKALSAEERFLQQDKERYLYEMREKALRDHLSAMYYAKEEGREEGREEGIRETALRLLAMGLLPADVSKGTGLSLEEVEKLRKD